MRKLMRKLYITFQIGCVHQALSHRTRPQANKLPSNNCRSRSPSCQVYETLGVCMLVLSRPYGPDLTVFGVQCGRFHYCIRFTSEAFGQARGPNLG